jgi:hypothetical protein
MRISGSGSIEFAAAGAFVKELTGVGRHCLCLGGAADRAGHDRFETYQPVFFGAHQFAGAEG